MVLVTEFCDIHDIRKDTIFTMRCLGLAPYVVMQGKRAYIDVDFLIRRREFKRKVWLEAHENYFFLSKAMTDSAIARSIILVTGEGKVNNWCSYMSQTLFAIDGSSIISHNISDSLWVFWRVTNWIIRMHFKQMKVLKENRDLERIWNETSVS